ncbi:MFS transporter [Saccharothrix violaceirubra]|uniref:MFS family permease n=1 Tax=Saccharothrix violaceirubra TaxID=413306 RepID=A0A7W7T7C6_9PSEU|nr:MFS transporter [Saccharothrix violaceirubra]MBB4967691.1 MFS family permease [Saccharothrix violaceirubra]
MTTVDVVQRKVLRVLAGTQVLGSAGVTIGLTVSALAAASLSGSDTVGGVAQTSAVLGSALFALPAARLAARSGRRPALIAGYGIGALGAVCAAIGVITESWQVVVAALLLFGAAGAANLSTRYAAADLADPSRRARSMALVVWMATVGAVAGPNLAEPAGKVARALDLPVNAGPFLLSAVVFAAAGVFVLALLRPDPLTIARSRAAVVTPAHCAGGVADTRGSWQVWRSLSGQARLALSAIALCHTAMVGLMSMTPVHMNHAGSSLSVVGIVISLHVAGMYIASPVFGWLADRVGRVPVLAIGSALVVAAAAIAGMAESHDAPQLAIGLTVLGFGWSAGLVSGSALLTESVSPDDRPAAQGLSDLLMNVAGAAGGIAAGVVVATWSFAALGLVVGVTALPLLVVCLFAALR